MDTALIIELLVSAGVFTAIAETVRWFLGRGKSRVDNAKVVQGMALDLLKPLHDELSLAAAEVSRLRTEVSAARSEASTARSEVRVARNEIEALVVWVVAAVSILEENHLEYPTVPSPAREKIQR